MFPRQLEKNHETSPSPRDEARFPCLGSRAIPCSPLYTTSGLTSFRQLPRFRESPVLSLWEQKFQHRNSRKAPCTPYHLVKRADPQDSIEEVGQLSQAPQVEPSLRNRYVRGTLSLLTQVESIPRFPDSKEGWISLQSLECRLVFHFTR